MKNKMQKPRGGRNEGWKKKRIQKECWTGKVLSSVMQSLDELRRLEGLTEEKKQTQEDTDANAGTSIKPEKGNLRTEALVDAGGKIGAARKMK